MKSFIKSLMLLLFLTINSKCIALTFQGGYVEEFNLGTLGIGAPSWTTDVTIGFESPFLHRYLFTVNQNTTFAATASPLNASQISNFSFILLDGYYSGIVAVPIGGSLSAQLTTLYPYILRVDGLASGTNDSYAVNLAVAPIPEPEQWMMMLVGLMMVTVKTFRASTRKKMGCS